MKIDPNARYLESHEWARRDGELFVCGVSDHAQESLGDVVFVELPEPGTVFKKGEVFGVIESVKAAYDLYIPLGGEIVAINQDLEKSPESVNKDPFGAGWLIKIKPASPAEWDSLLAAADYERTAQ